MPNLRYLANMNISPKTVEFLAQKGWDIFRVSKKLPATAPDELVLKLAGDEGRVIVTQDLDFSNLIATSGKSSPSLITLRLSVSDPDTVSRKLLTAVPQYHAMLEKGCILIIEDHTSRSRLLPI